MFLAVCCVVGISDLDLEIDAFYHLTWGVFDTEENILKFYRRSKFLKNIFF